MQRERTIGTKLAAVLRSRIFWPLAAGISAFTLTAGLIAYANYPGRPKLHFDIELTEKACCSFQVWVNGKGPYDMTSVDVKPGTRSTYSVPLQTQFVHFLQIALAGPSTVGDTLKFRRIWTARGDRTIDQISAEEFRAFGGSNVVLQPETQGLRIRTTEQYPYVVTTAGLITDAGPRRLFFIELGANPFPAIAALLLLGVALTVPFGIASRRHVLMVVGLAATLLVVRVLPWASHNLFELRDDVSEAVGYSPFAGQWKTRERAILEGAALAALLVPALAGFGLWLVGRRAREAKSVEATQLTARSKLSLPAAALLVTAPIVVFGLLGMPDLKAMIGSGRTIQYSPGWDTTNLLFWKYLVRTTDLAPMKDFFWPYGFQWVFDEGWPWGELASYGVHLSFWIWLTLGVYVALSRSFAGPGLVIRYAGLMGFWLVIALAGFVPFSARYIGPLGVVLLYAGIDSRDRLLSARRVLFAVALFELALFELAQAAYAIVPVAFLVVTEFLLEVRRTWPEFVGWLRRAAVTVGLPIAAALGTYAAAGTLGGNVDYYGELDALNSAYAFPSAVDAWIRDPRSIDSFVFWAVPLTIAVGMLGLLLQPGRARLPQAVVVALGLLALMVMQKQILRPDAVTEIWQTALFGLAFWFAVESSLNSVRRSMATAAVAGTALAIVLMSGDLRTGWSSVKGAPERASATIEALLDDRDEFAADERAEFLPARFTNFKAERAVVRRLRRDPAVRNGDPLWILGDDSVITILLGRSWPYYYSELYDTSPISFQRRLLSRLEKLPPQRVVWSYLASSFDAVPHVVRVPLLIDWTVRHFAPREETDAFAILRPLERGEAAHLDWWRSRLGATINLGHVPEAAEVHGGECPNGEACETYLVVDYPESVVPPAEVVVPMSVAGRSFEVRFPTSADSDRYVVRLDRLWFWTTAPSGSRRGVDTSGLAGAKVTFERRAIDPDSLY